MYVCVYACMYTFKEHKVGGPGRSLDLEGVRGKKGVTMTKIQCMKFIKNKNKKYFKRKIKSSSTR